MAQDKILAFYVQKALTKKSGEGTRVVKQVLPKSKMVIGPHYLFMDDNDINKDVSEFNIWRSKKKRAIVDPADVRDTADKMYSDFLAIEAKKKENEFERREEKINTTMNNGVHVKNDMAKLTDKLRQKRIAKNIELEKIQKKPGMTPEEESKVKDLPIG